MRDIIVQLREDFTVVIDGEVKEFKNVNAERVYSVIYERTTYLTVRTIGEIMEKVYWYENDKRIELKNSTVTDADVIIVGDEKNDDKLKKKTLYVLKMK